MSSVPSPMDGDANPALREAANVAATAGPHTFGLAQCHEVIARLAAQVEDLQALVAVLQERLKLASTNSSKPPFCVGLPHAGASRAALARRVKHKRKGVAAMNGTALATAGRFGFVASDQTGRPWITLIVLRGVHQTGAGSHRYGSSVSDRPVRWLEACSTRCRG